MVDAATHLVVLSHLAYRVVELFIVSLGVLSVVVPRELQARLGYELMSAPRYLAQLHLRGVVLVSIYEAKTPKARVVAHESDTLVVFHLLRLLWSAKHIGHTL